MFAFALFSLSLCAGVRACVRVCVRACVRVCVCVCVCVYIGNNEIQVNAWIARLYFKTERERGGGGGRERKRERERERERENNSKSDSKTLFHKDCNLRSVKNMSNN